MAERSKLIPADVADVWQMIVAYAKQETLGELKPLGRFVLWGTIGSVFLSVAFLELTLALLRGLQDETGSTFAGHLSWIPYLIAIVLCSAAAAIFATRINADRTKG